MAINSLKLIIQGILKESYWQKIDLKDFLKDKWSIKGFKSYTEVHRKDSERDKEIELSD